MNGLCECGCGRPTRVARQTDHRRGVVKGEPARFLPGHHARFKLVEENRGYETPCLIFKGKLNRKGYPHNRHRRAWVERNGPIPEGMEIDHLCRQRDCVNTDHMELVTHEENMRRSSIARAAESTNSVGLLRAELQLTQRELADLLGVSRSLVGLWEQGKHPVLEPHATRLRELSGVRAE